MVKLQEMELAQAKQDLKNEQFGLLRECLCQLNKYINWKKRYKKLSLKKLLLPGAGIGAPLAANKEIILPKLVWNFEEQTEQILRNTEFDYY